MSREQIEEMAKIIARRSVAFRNPNVAFMTTATKTAESLYSAGYRKQEWISVDERLPEDVYKDRKIITVLVCTKSGRVSTSSRVRMMRVNKEKMNYEYTDIFEWSGQIAKKVTHWMPLPEAPKGGAE